MLVSLPLVGPGGGNHFALTQTLDPCAGEIYHFLFMRLATLHIELTGTKHRTPWKHTISNNFTRPQPVGCGENVFFFLIVIMSHIKLRGTKHRTPRNITFNIFTHPRPLGWMKMSFRLLESKRVAHPPPPHPSPPPQKKKKKKKGNKCKAACKQMFDLMLTSDPKAGY